MTDAERCVTCGAVIPEGRQVCPICYAKYHNDYSEELAYLWKVLKKTESSLKTADKRNAPNEERANLRKRRDMLYTIINIVVTPCDTSDVVIVDEIASGERGENGFGSTGR